MVEQVFESIAVKQLDVGTEQHQAGKTGRPAFFHANTNVKLGDYFNAAKAYMDFGTAGTGEVAGMASSFNAEIRLPNKTVTGGAYTALEVNYNFQASTVLQNQYQAIASFKVGGNQTGIDAWEAQTNSAVFSFTGLTAANDEVFDEQGGGTHTDSLRILVNGSPYWIMLTDNPGA